MILYSSLTSPWDCKFLLRCHAGSKVALELDKEVKLSTSNSILDKDLRRLLASEHSGTILT